MRAQKLNGGEQIFTPGSETTVRVLYSATQRILEVEFTGRRVYHYLEVEDLTWEEYKSVIASGGSSGKFINTRIKPSYDCYEVA